MANLNVLMVLTSHDQLGDTGEKTGFWVEEFAAPYYVLVDAGVNVTVASPLGGQAPIDPKSELDDFQTQDTKRYYEDESVQALVANTKVLANIDASEFDAVFYPGGHGPLWDLTDNAHSIALVEAFVAANKPVAAVCHATAVLLKAKDQQGQPLVKGKSVTGFSNTEEAAVELTEVVPFLLEDELVKLGADYQKVDDWHPLSIKDGLLISGQNPASSAPVAQTLLKTLSE